MTFLSWHSHRTRYASFNYYHYQTSNEAEIARATCIRVAFALDFHRNLQDLGGNCFLQDISSITATHRATPVLLRWFIDRLKEVWGSWSDVKTEDDLTIEGGCLVCCPNLSMN